MPVTDVGSLTFKMAVGQRYPTALTASRKRQSKSKGKDKNIMVPRASWLIVLAALCAALSLTQPAHAGGPQNGTAKAKQFVQTNLVSDIAGLATATDASLKNPWGVSHSATSPFWVSDQGTSEATLYKVTDSTTVTKVGLTVTIPKTASGPQGPTGQVNNTNNSSFPVNGASAHFIFANLNGTISAWNGGTTATIEATTAGAVYTGLAINSSQTQLYAARTGGIDVFDSLFKPVTSLGTNAFKDPEVPSGLVPFNVQDIGGNVYVTYAPAGRASQTSAPLGAGAIAIFNENGNFIKQLVTGDRLAAPWGITIAPPGFGPFSNAVLVGNFSYLHSEINAFDASSGVFRGTLPIDTGTAAPGGLWYIGFGTGGSNGSPDTLYFSDGINGESDGLFGAIQHEPGQGS
jgi:uncharacterized protein (TIGR03118 family)